MKYLNALNVFPDDLINEIRKYIPEGVLYIPAPHTRKAWGSVSGLKHEIMTRNSLIYKEFLSGKTAAELSKEYYLSVSSIYRILNNYK